MKKALILTVGTGTRPDTNIVNPLKKTILDSNPDFTVLMASLDSQVHAQMIMDELKLCQDQARIVIVPNPDKIHDVFKAINAQFRGLYRMGFECHQIAVDYTSGTKAMTGGLVLSAVANGCETLKYITGQRRNGVVMDGTEEFLSLSSSSILAHYEIQIGRRFILSYRFDAAQDVLNRVNSALLDEYDAKVAENLMIAAGAFKYWDTFDHARFTGEYPKISFEFRELAEFRVGDRTLEALRVLLRAQKSGSIVEDTLADMYNNAYRRFQEGKFDDAMARLYRLTEMMGQWAMAKLGLRSDDLDLEKVPDALREDYARFREPSDGKVKIGLARGYQLLAALNVELGRAFKSDKSLQGRLNSRNNSILAHGVKPVAKDECSSMLRILGELAADHVPGFLERVNALRFPWDPVANVREKA